MIIQQNEIKGRSTRQRVSHQASLLQRVSGYLNLTLIPGSPSVMPSWIPIAISPLGYAWQEEKVLRCNNLRDLIFFPHVSAGASAPHGKKLVRCCTSGRMTWQVPAAGLAVAPWPSHRNWFRHYAGPAVGCLGAAGWGLASAASVYTDYQKSGLFTTCSLRNSTRKVFPTRVRNNWQLGPLKRPRPPTISVVLL